MTTITWSTSKADFNAAMRRAPEVLARNMANATRRNLLEISRLARHDAPKAFSTLANSIQIEMHSPLDGITGPAADYGEMVEKGTGPGGFPPLETMLDWIRTKNITPENPLMRLEHLAFVMSRSISKKGTPAQPYLEPAAEQLQGNVLRNYDLALERSLDEIARH